MKPIIKVHEIRLTQDLHGIIFNIAAAHNVVALMNAR